MGAAMRGLGFAVMVMVMVLLPVLGVSSQLPAAVATSACPSGVVALTFDDGPDVHTAEVLDVLAAHRAPGTFFVIGQNVDKRPELVRRAADEGHEVANHSYTHRDLEMLTHDEIRWEVSQTDRAIREAGVVPLALLRPPFGHWDGPGGLVATAAESEGYRVVTWTYSPTDYLNDAETIRTRVLANLHPDANLLFHDGSSNAPELIAALPDIIQGARDQGYCLGVLDNHGRVVARHLERFEPTDPGCHALSGDWNGSGRDGIGWWCDGQAKLRTSNGSLVEFVYGRAGDIPIVADWNGNGRDSISVIRDGTWHVNNRLRGGAAERTFVYGRVSRGDVPITGAWDYGTRDLPGIVRDREWHLRNAQNGGSATWLFIYGRLTAGDLPLVGDWTGDGRDTVGVVREGRWLLRDRLAGGAADLSYIYGRVKAGDVPVTGDWVGDGADTPAIVRDGRWYLKYQHGGGNADQVITFLAP